MSDITLDTVASGYNLGKINQNFEKIEDVINEKILHLSGDNNIMQQNLDMNENRILNLPEPLSGTEPIRLKDLKDLNSLAALNLPIADLRADYGAVGDAVYQYEVDGSVTVVSGVDDTQALLDAMADFASGTIAALTIPAGNFWIDSSQIDCPTGTTIIGAGSDATKFIMSTTNPNLNLFVGVYDDTRVSNLHFSGFKIIGSKVNDNNVGGIGIFTLGTEGVTLENLHSEGGKGLVWLGEDRLAVGGYLYGTTNVFARNLRVDDCTLFSVYVRGGGGR